MSSGPGRRVWPPRALGRESGRRSDGQKSKGEAHALLLAIAAGSVRSPTGGAASRDPTTAVAAGWGLALVSAATVSWGTTGAVMAAATVCPGSMLRLRTIPLIGDRIVDLERSVSLASSVARAWETDAALPAGRRGKV